MKNYLLLLTLLFTISINSQGKLEKAKQNLSSQSSSTTQSSVTREVRTSNSNDNRTYSSSNDEPITFIGVFGKLIFWGSIGVVFGEAQERRLNPYSYYNDAFGEYSKDLELKKKTSLKLGVNHFINTVKGFEFSGEYKVLPILGIKALHTHFYEKRLANKTDFLNVTSIMANYYRVREKHVTIWWGIGASYVGNEVKKAGFVYSFGTEIYPLKPISLHVSWKQSLINNTSIDAFKTHVKYHYKKAALVLGYNNFNLAGEKNAGVTLGLEYTF